MNISANMISPEKNYLEIYDQTVDDEKFSLIRQWMKSEPLPFFKQLRHERPILNTPECVLVALFDDVRDVLQMPKIFTVDLYKPKMGVTDQDEGYLMAHDDDALHYREKSLMQGMLNRDDLPRVRKLISEESLRILNEAQGAIDIVDNYCRMVPCKLVQKYFGLDDINPKNLIEWSYWNQYDVFHNQAFDLNSPEKTDHIIKKHTEGTEQLEKYIAKTLIRKLAEVKIEQTKNMVLIGWYFIKHSVNRLLGKKTVSASDDIFSRMLKSSFAKEVDFNLVRVGVNAGGLLIGAIETTSQAVSQVIQFFLSQPALLERAKLAANEREKEQFDNMVWEALRFVPISPYMFRQVSEDYILAKGTNRETLIRKGTKVLTLTQSAMFDSYSYAKPEEFNPNRNWYHHFNYGYGSHDCLGKYIGMEMIPEMVRQVIRLPDIHSTSDIDYNDGPFPESYHLEWTQA